MRSPSRQPPPCFFQRAKAHRLGRACRAVQPRVCDGVSAAWCSHVSLLCVVEGSVRAAQLAFDVVDHWPQRLRSSERCILVPDGRDRVQHDLHGRWDHHPNVGFMGDGGKLIAHVIDGCALCPASNPGQFKREASEPLGHSNAQRKWFSDGFAIYPIPEMAICSADRLSQFHGLPFSPVRA